MEHLSLKAVSTATDAGTFEAVISTASIDREKDIVDPAGMVRAVQKWIPTGKNIPLAWNHSTAPEHQIGYIDPKSARVQGSEVVVKGWIDQSTDAGAHAWRMVKAGTLGFSFGYLTLVSSPRKGGGKFLKEIDLFEATATGTPMNNDTRVLGWKAAAEVEEQEQDTLETVIELMGDFLDTEDDAQDIATARDIVARLQRLLAAENAEAPAKALSMADLRAKADALALEHATGGESHITSVEQPEPDVAQDAKSLADLFAADELDAALAAQAKDRLARSDLPQDVKDLLAGRAQRILDANQPEKPAASPAKLRAKADAVALDHATGGQSEQAPAKQEQPAEPVGKNLAELFAADEIEAALAAEAKGRVAQSNLSQDVKDFLAGRAQRLLDEKKASTDGAAQAERRAADPLRGKADALALEHASGGESLKKPSRPAQKAPTPDLVPLKDLKERMYEEMVDALRSS